MSPGGEILSRVLERNIVYTILFLLILSCNERNKKLYTNCIELFTPFMIPMVGVEPTLPKEHDFESCASANSATSAQKKGGNRI